MGAMMEQADRLYHAAVQIATDAGIERITPDDMVWLLTEEAAWTASTFDGPPRSRLPSKSAWPEFREDDFFAVERERLSSGVEGEEPQVRLRPTAAQVSRYGVMRDLWNRHALGAYAVKPQLRKALWVYALGVRPAKIKRWTGISRQRLHHAKMRGCEDIAEHLGWLEPVVDISNDFC